MYIIYDSDSDNCSKCNNVLGYCNTKKEAVSFCSQNSGIHYKRIQNIEKLIRYKCSKKYSLEKDKVKTYIASNDVKGFADYIQSIINKSEYNVFSADAYIKTNSDMFFNTIESSWFYDSYPIYVYSAFPSAYLDYYQTDPNIIKIIVRVSITKDELDEVSKLCDDKLLEYVNKCKSILNVKELIEFNMDEMRK